MFGLHEAIVWCGWNPSATEKSSGGVDTYEGQEPQTLFVSKKGKPTEPGGEQCGYLVIK